ncbi:MAG: AAA family ATPase [Lachnospiraceae bacterium]|nr:AAA family ATPase [Lachnospiraceae bacterium]
MQFTSLHIKNFKYIRDMRISDIENALILVGKNNTGKTAVLEAVRAVAGAYKFREEDFNEKRQKVEIDVTLSVTEEDLLRMHRYGIVSQYKRYEAWYEDFCRKLPSCHDGELQFTYMANAQGKVRYSDGIKKNNPYIPKVLPKIYFISTDRKLKQLQENLLSFEEDRQLKQIRSDTCMFEQGKRCNRCFQCVGLINQKSPAQMSAVETAKLLEYKLAQLNLREFSARLNRSFRRNGGFDEIHYEMRCDMGKACTVKAEAFNQERNTATPIERMGKGMRSIYMLSLLETYAEGEDRVPSVILVEDPETFLHPQLQKNAEDILYRLSKKNQVMFSTHSPNMIFNFSSRQIRQVVLDEQYYTTVREKVDMDEILDDLGFNASDLMNVSFVFIVEGKQDKSRLPLLLEKNYSEMYDGRGKLSRIAIITTNSCTNIKTYANLKYMNQIYLRDQFLMIRDGDGEDPGELAARLCKYYEERSLEDVDRLPRVTGKNVLILKYYSFENYFLNPEIMVKVGVLEKEDDFYHIFLEKWKEYLYRIRSGRHLTEMLGFQLQTENQVREHMEEIKRYMRGHNLFDIFYGPFRKREQEILKRYIELAPRQEFQDIFEAVERFAYFESRKRQEDTSITPGK